MKTRNNNTYKLLDRHSALIFDLHSKSRTYTEIAARIGAKEDMYINRKRISEYIRLKVEEGKFDPNKTIWDSENGSDVYQLKEQYRKAVECIPAVVAPNNPRYNGKEFNVLCLSDLHIGQLIKPIDVDNANEYNEEVIAARLGQVLEQVRALENKDVLHVFMLGDLVHGDLPNKQDFILSQEYGIVRQTLRATHLLKNFFIALLEEFNTVEVYAVSGNHGRLPNKSKMPNIQRSENFDWMTVELLQDIFADNNRLNLRNSEGFYSVFEIRGARFAITHGHQFGAGLYGDAKNIFQNINIMYSPDKSLDVIVYGHFHHFNAQELPHHKKVIGVGSLVGADPFARNDLMKSSVPSQALLKFEQNRLTRRYVNTDIRLLYVD